MKTTMRRGSVHVKSCGRGRSRARSPGQMPHDREGLQTRSHRFAFSGAGSMAAALALLALVSLATTAQLDSGDPLSSSELAVVMVLLGVVAVLVIGVGVVTFGSGYAIFGDNRRKLIAALLITALLAVLIALLLAPVDAPPGGGGSLPRRRRPREPGPADDYFHLSDNTFAAIAAAVIAGVALLAAALVVLGAKGLTERRRGALAEPEDEDKAMLQAVDESLDDLRRERDVRRAIIACYARMERALERAGNARRPAEAPLEYLVRVLERITANGRAARALTELFERAKFSVEPMGEGDKQRAIGALELLRAEVSQPP